MKHLLRRGTALLLVLCLLGTPALASYAMGDELHTNTSPLAQGTTLTQQLIWSNSNSDLRTENYVTYAPNSGVIPMVAFGNTVLSKQTVTAMAKSLENSGRRVLSGSNGDYFDMGTGNPLGLLVSDGILRSSASYLSAVGFRADGSAVISQPALSITASFGGNDLKVEAINKTRADNGYFLYNRDFGVTTTNTKPGIDVILTPVSNNIGAATTLPDGQVVTQYDVLRIGGRMSFVVDEVLQSTSAISIPDGKYIMSINNNGAQWSKDTLAALQPGDSLHVSIASSDTRWNDVVNAVGAMHRIVIGGVADSSITDSSGTASRTAVGVKADGTVIFYTIDGRQAGYSIGSSIAQVAQRLVELGCVDAVCLDGGGSTTLGATKPDSSLFQLVNKPSEGSQRAVTNALFLVSSRNANGTPAHVYVTAKDQVLAGKASTSFTTSFVDNNWYPTNGTESVSFSASRGSFDANGVYTAPADSCVDTITATTPSGLTGSTTVTVFASPNAIRITNTKSGERISSLTLNPKASVTLAATATYQTIPLATGSSNYTWSVEPATLGSFSGSTFTASETGGSGSLKVTSGTHTASIPLSVNTDAHYVTLANFEGSGHNMDNLAAATLTLDTTADNVNFGKQSLRWGYDLSSGVSSFDATLPLSTSERYLSVWVYGNNGGATLEATCMDSGGQAFLLSFGKIDFTGWKQLWAALPAEPTTLKTIRLSGSGTGTIWLDQLCSANMNAVDATGPTVALTIDGTQLTAKITDNSDTSFAASQLTLTVNGKSQTFSYDAGTLSATLPSVDGALQRVTVQAIDQSGNIGRASKTLTGSSAASPFVDMGGHWAVSHTTFLSSLNIISGMEEGGKLYFHPNQSITRGDFALMTARWMGLDLNSYASVTLPFSDTSSIPSWSLNAVKAMYSLGIMKGTADNGSLYASANANITRAEAMTILGRIQIKGYPAASLTAFKDASSVPSWAKSYVAKLVGQGVVGGYDDSTLRTSNSVSRAEVAKMLLTLW